MRNSKEVETTGIQTDPMDLGNDISFNASMEFMEYSIENIVEYMDYDREERATMNEDSELEKLNTAQIYEINALKKKKDKNIFMYRSSLST